MVSESEKTLPKCTISYLFELINLVNDIVGNTAEFLHSPDPSHVYPLFVYCQDVVDLTSFQICRPVVADSIREDVLHLAKTFIMYDLLG